MRLLSILIAAVVVFSGCANKTPGNGDPGNGDPSGGPDGTGPDGTGPGGTTGPGPAGNGSDTPPSATLVAVPVQGAPPLEVTFTINATDPDGDNITWSLDANGDGAEDHNGTTVPATVVFSFAAAGSFVANLTVTAGNVSVHAEAPITINAVPPAGPTQVVDGTYVVAAEGCGGPGYDAAETDPLGMAGDELDEVVRVQFAVAASTLGKPFSASFTFDQGYIYVAVNFYDGDDDLLSSRNTGQSPNFGGVTLTGNVPQAAAKAVLFACAGPTQASVHYEA